MLQPIQIEIRRRREHSTVEWLACRAIKNGRELHPDPNGKDWMFFADADQVNEVLFRFGFFATGLADSTGGV